MTVHDENVISINPDYLIEEARLLASSMEELEDFDVPFIVEMEQGENWHELTLVERNQ